MRYQSSGAQIRNQISVFGNLWHRDVRYNICTAQGCRTAQTRSDKSFWKYGTGMSDIKYVPHRDAVQIRLDLHIYGTGMPRHGDALYIYK